MKKITWPRLVLPPINLWNAPPIKFDGTGCRIASKDIVKTKTAKRQIEIMQRLINQRQGFFSEINPH